MRLNKKGIGGFTEAIAAMMVVCVALTAFMGVFTYTQTQECMRELDFSDCICDNTEFKNSKIVFDESEVLSYIERYDLGNVTVSIKVNTVYYSEQFHMRYGGSFDYVPDNLYSDFGTAVIHCDNGTAFAMSYEVVYWYL